jgi:hypothetical protein
MERLQMTRKYDSDDVYFDGLTLRFKTGRVLAVVVPDDKWPNMYRVRIGGDISDMANLSRAKDAAINLALAELRRSRDEAA